MVIVVNSPGLQVRRAQQFARHATRYSVRDIVVAPRPESLLSTGRGADIIYVIDAGKSGAAAFAAARLRGIDCVVEIGDPQAALYRAQQRPAASVAAGLVIDQALKLFASGVVVRGRALGEGQGIHGPWTWLPDGVDLERFAPQASSPVRSTLGIAPDRMLVGVVGSVTWSSTRSWCYGMEIVEALGRLPGRPIDGLVVGDGTGLEHVRRRAAELGVADRIHTVGRVEHREVPAYLAAMDVCVSTQTDDSIGQGRTTAKLPEYLACGRYVLATDVGEAARLLPPEMLVPYVGSWDETYASNLAHRLDSLLPELEWIRTHAGTRRIAEETFNYQALTAHWEAFLDRIRGAPQGCIA